MPIINPTTTQKRTALQLLNTVLGELGMPLTNSVNALDDTAVQLLYLANGLGSRMAKLPFWADLAEEFTVTTTTAEAYDLPVDWGVPLYGTTWDRSNRWPLVGPVTSSQWQVLKSGLGQAYPRFRFRYKGGQFLLHTAPEAGHTIVQEYLSTGWVLGIDGAVASQRKPRISSDSDYVLLDEEMFITGTKLAWLEAKGLDSSKALVEFNSMLEAGWANNSGAPVLEFVRTDEQVLLGYQNIPDTGYGPP